MRIVRCLVLFVAVCSTLVLSAQERWDAETSMYVNHAYGFAWNLDSDLDWEKSIGTEMHTVFRARCPDFGLVAFVNVQHSIVDEFDVWTKFNEIRRMNEKLGKQAMAKQGFSMEIVAFEKTHISGRHAIRVVTKAKPNKGMEYAGEPFTQYTIRTVHHGRNWSITISLPTAIDEVLKKEEINIDYLFTGFKFTAS